MTGPRKSTSNQLVAIKRAPQRPAGRQTQAAILATAAELLEEMGFEKLSTNKICQRAGMSPPALYHFFPNKYSILFELAHDLLVLRHLDLNAWLTEDGFAWSTQHDGVARIDRLLTRQRVVVDNRVGALWIMRALRAIPALQEIRGVAHAAMSVDIEAALQAVYPQLVDGKAMVPARLVEQMVHHAIEMEIDASSLDPAALRGELSLSIVAYIDATARRAGG